MTNDAIQAILSELSPCWELITSKRVFDDRQLVTILSTDTRQQYSCYIESGEDKSLRDTLIKWVRDFCLVREKAYYLDTSRFDRPIEKPDAKRHRARGST